MKKINMNLHVIRRIIITIFSLLVGISVAVVMFNMYEPNQNALGALASVCMDVLCIIILFILIWSFSFTTYGRNHTTRIFAVLLIATIWAIFLDFLNWAFDGVLEFGELTFWFTLGSLCMGSILACIFSVYLYRYMDETHNLSRMKKRAYVCASLNLVSFCLTFVLAITGTAFKYVDGHYEIGALYDIVTVIPILTLLYLTAFVIRYVKEVGLHDVFAAVGYILFMIVGALIESSYRIGTTYVAVAIADIFIFVMLQNSIIAQEKRNVQKWMTKSKTDVLTGFYNRQAYEMDLALHEKNPPSDDFVYVSADVNSLKAVNDSLGHYAGDELLVGAAECLKKCFGSYGKLYRIGGDEFIALIYMNEEQIEKIQSSVDETTKRWSGKLATSLAISCGFVAKTEDNSMSVTEMALLADQRMYKAKNEYYRSRGIDRRRN